MKTELSKVYQDNNFNLLRLLAALFVLISHSFGLLGKGLQQPGLWYNQKHLILSDAGLYIFFTISGYLVTQSLFNANSLKHYAWKRLLRIMPALVVVNLFCIIIGGFVTTLPLQQYLLNTSTWSYLFKNTTLLVNQFTLPGVFATLRDQSVNASLWTLLVEVECYVVLLLGASVIVIRKWLFLFCFILFEALRIYMRVVNKIEVAGLDIEAYFTYGTYFYLGSLFYCFKDDIRFRWFYANILLGTALITVYSILQPVTEAIFFAYCILIAGRSKALLHLKGYDLSYGLYLYAFPVQQLLLLYFGYSVPVWMHIFLSAFISLICALLSWSFVESRFLKMKNRSSFLPT